MGQNVVPVPVRMRGAAFPPLAVVASALLTAACGRRATHADCQLIVDKSVELEMRAMSRNDALAVQKREEQVRAELEHEIESCEGRRVTEKTMACVQAASTTQELDKCLR